MGAQLHDCTLYALRQLGLLKIWIELGTAWADPEGGPCGQQIPHRLRNILFNQCRSVPQALLHTQMNKFNFDPPTNISGSALVLVRLTLYTQIVVSYCVSIVSKITQARIHNGFLLVSCL